MLPGIVHRVAGEVRRSCPQGYDFANGNGGKCDAHGAATTQIVADPHRYVGDESKEGVLAGQIEIGASNNVLLGAVSVFPEGVSGDGDGDVEFLTGSVVPTKKRPKAG